MSRPYLLVSIGLPKAVLPLWRTRDSAAHAGKLHRDLLIFSSNVSLNFFLQSAFQQLLKKITFRLLQVFFRDWRSWGCILRQVRNSGQLLWAESRRLRHCSSRRKRLRLQRRPYGQCLLIHRIQRGNLHWGRLPIRLGRDNERGNLPPKSVQESCQCHSQKHQWRRNELRGIPNSLSCNFCVVL